MTLTASDIPDIIIDCFTYLLTYRQSTYWFYVVADYRGTAGRNRLRTSTEAQCSTRVGHGLDPPMDWMGLD